MKWLLNGEDLSFRPSILEHRNWVESFFWKSRPISSRTLYLIIWVYSKEHRIQVCLLESRIKGQMYTFAFGKHLWQMKYSRILNRINTTWGQPGQWEKCGGIQERTQGRGLRGNRAAMRVFIPFWRGTNEKRNQSVFLQREEVTDGVRKSYTSRGRHKEAACEETWGLSHQYRGKQGIICL